ncbi:antitoxin MazE family protein [Erythrobacter litoralis]|uniref:DUF3018 family protein n=1 Tax=Erythrobacter litoralis (strain HTCC2594) TaxID=314225 RepID=Q2NC16_ERYLH|nr:antitoxin MazE family protein [Erythrobacter litoralis]ABC62775.1 hypothetical protein ELI_03415 [Erythrobacter litoralis HTCC2594]
MGKHDPLTDRQRVARHRAKLRAQGLRPKQFWLPDLGDPRIRSEIAGQCRKVSQHAETAEAQDLIDAIIGEMLVDIEASEDEAKGA